MKIKRKEYERMRELLAMQIKVETRNGMVLMLMSLEDLAVMARGGYETSEWFVAPVRMVLVPEGKPFPTREANGMGRSE